jgi:RNA polymerase sigma-70 factor, ECF subfamily
VIKEALALTPWQIGFKSKIPLDESPQDRRKTRVAVARAKQGDHDALRYLYVTYSDNVYGYVRSIVRDEHEAEDITQHVFSKLMTKLSKYDDRGLPFLAWLLPLARNASIDQMRVNRLTPVATVVDPRASTNGDFDQRQTVWAALEVLPAAQREVVVLRHVAGLSPGEIADRMGRTTGSVDGLHHRGRRALQRELERLEAMPVTRPVREFAA